MTNGMITLDGGKGKARVQVLFGLAILDSGVMPILEDTGTIYTQEALKAALNRVTDVRNWKNKLPGVEIERDEVLVTIEAVRHYCGGIVNLKLNHATDRVKVTGLGYYGWIGA